MSFTNRHHAPRPAPRRRPSVLPLRPAWLAAAVLLLAACPGGPSPAEGVRVKVRASATTLLTGSALQLTATVTGTEDGAVAWSATRGGIDATGLFTAPADPGPVLVTATSHADPSRAGTLALAVARLDVAVSPPQASVLSGEPLQLTASVTGWSDTRVTWSSTAGSVSASGRFHAPATLGPVEVTATSVADPSRAATAALSVREVPTVVLTTTGGVPVDSRETYVQGTITVDARDGVTPEFSAPLSIRGRGNSTWDFPKKPYKLKLDAKAGLLGMPADKEWALLANYSDKSLMRNHVALELSRRAGLAWTPRDQFVEVTLNGDDLGTYTLVETVKIAPGRVAVTPMTSAPFTGGYLVEVDERLDGTNHFTTSREVDLVLKDPGSPGAEALAYYEADLRATEDALYAPGFADPATGYPALLDVDSFVRWFLVNELFKNVDANFYSSCFLFKDQGGKLTMGPVWDFDLGAGNVNYNDVGRPYDPVGWYIRVSDERMTGRAVWLQRLFQDPAFAARFRARWLELKETQLDTLRAYVEDTAAGLRHAEARNFSRWPILGAYVWPNADGWDTRTTYASEVEFLEDWLDARVAWIDAQVR